MKTILVLDDHPLVRKAVAERVETLLHPCTILQASSLASATALLAEHTVDLLVVDAMLGDGCGLDLTHGEGAPAITYTLLGPDEVATRNPGTRLVAIVGKHEDPEKLDEALLQAFGNSAGAPSLECLSQSERNMLDSLLKGKRLVEIAKESGVGHSTVQSYKNRMLAKLGLKSHHDLIKLAARKGWLA